MYFDSSTTSSSLQLPFNNFDTTKKKCFWHMSDNSTLTRALLALLAVVAIFSSSTGFVIDSPAFVRPLPTNNNQISAELVLSTSTPELEIVPLTPPSSEPAEQDENRYVDVFEQWNLSQDEYEDKVCDDNMELELCPTEASVSCGSIDKVEQFCEALLGSSNTRSTTVNRNALEGCKIYVSWNHGSCCHASFCESEYGDDSDDEIPKFLVI